MNSQEGGQESVKYVTHGSVREEEGLDRRSKGRLVLRVSQTRCVILPYDGLSLLRDCPFQLLFSCSVMSSSLRPHEQQHARLPCPSLSAGGESVMSSNRLILCCPLLLQPSVFPSISIFFSESALHIWWPNCWSFSFSISPSNEYVGLISFGIDQMSS